MTRTVGIIGGMGPAATADLMTKLVAETPAARDQDHIRVIVDSNPAIPDRTEAILANGPSPAPLIVESARLLESAGADFLVMACNTAHTYVAEIRSAVGIPFLSIIDATVAEVLSLHGGRTVGILATTACLTAGMYQEGFADAGVAVVTLEPDRQAVLMETIESIKASGSSPEAVAGIGECVEWLSSAGAQVVVAGCTEVPLVLSDGGALPLVSSTDALARATVAYALGQSA